LEKLRTLGYWQGPLGDLLPRGVANIFQCCVYIYTSNIQQPIKITQPHIFQPVELGIKLASSGKATMMPHQAKPKMPMSVLKTYQLISNNGIALLQERRGKRLPGGPKKRYKDTLKEALKSFSINPDT